MQTVAMQIYPSYINKIWPIDRGDKPLKIPRGKLRVPVTRIIGKVILPILSSDLTSIQRVYDEKISSFQEYWIKLIQSARRNHLIKPNLTFYDHTFALVNSNPIFAANRRNIIQMTEILRDYEMNIHSKFPGRHNLLEHVLNEIDSKDFANSLYGSYLALMCFWLISRNETLSKKTIPVLAKISYKLAVKLDGYSETLDILTNPEEMDMMKRAEHWEKYNIQNRAK